VIGGDRLALLFAGQGSQAVGMGSELASSCAECRATFERVDRVLGFPLSRLMAEGPEEELQRTEVQQPALLALEVAQARHLRSLGYAPAALAGHSLGEYAALVAAGALELEPALRLVAERGRLMQEAVPPGRGAMAAIVGLDRARVYAACAEARALGPVAVAAHNAPGQTAISGCAAAVEAAADRCEDEGGGAVFLRVSVPFHSELLAPMLPRFSDRVAALPVSAPKLPVIDNVTARPLLDVDEVRRALVAQVDAPVLFEESLRHLLDAGVTHFIQCGPGRSALQFAAKLSREVRLESFEEATRAEGHDVAASVRG
jgi:[acyl-carrier-protein] S-malonyltransferase